MSASNDPQEMELELSAEIADGIYSNLAIVTHSHSEFILDFVSLMPGKPKPTVKSRIILTPQHAKRLVAALSDNIGKYESHFGAIREPEQHESIAFTMPPAQA